MSLRRWLGYLLAALLAVASAPARAQLSVVRADHPHCVGDSITVFGYCQAPHGVIDQIQAHWKPTHFANGHVVSVTGFPHVVSGAAATTSGAPAQFASFTSAGLVGGFAADIAGNVPGYITNFSPTVVFILLGINDADHATDPNAFATSYTSILTQVHSFNSAIQIGCLSLFANGELWQASGGSEGGHWGLNAVDAGIATLDTKIQTVCTGTGYSYYIPMRPLLGTWESTHNGTAPGAALGLATNPLDGIHPTPLGQALIGTFVVPQITVGP